jgi:hypothetical protein
LSVYIKIHDLHAFPQSTNFQAMLMASAKMACARHFIGSDEQGHGKIVHWYKCFHTHAFPQSTNFRRKPCLRLFDGISQNGLHKPFCSP